MKILVTGGTGFIGSHLVEILLDRGFEVRVLAHLHTFNIEHLSSNPRLEIAKGDIRIPDDCTKAVKGCDLVAHLATLISVDYDIKHPKPFWDTNVGGTFNMLDASLTEDVDRFVYMSSCEILGNIPKGKADENFPIRLPRSPYAASKYAAESYCRNFFSIYGFPVTIIRGFNVFGLRQRPGERGAVIPTLIIRVLQNEPPIIYGDGRQSRDYTYVKDVVHGLAKALNVKGIEGEIIHICSGIERSINEIAGKVIEACGSDIKPVHIKARPGELMRSVGDNTKAKAVLGWKPKYSFEEGLRLTISAYKKTQKKVRKSLNCKKREGLSQ